VTQRRSRLDRLIQFVRPRLIRDFAPPPTQVAPDLWTIERRLRMPGGPTLPTRSTVVRLPAGGLLVVSPPPVEAGGLAALDALGAVQDVLVPNSFHYLNAADFVARYPGATLRLAPGLHDRIAGLPGEELTASTPAAWGGAVEHQILGPVRGIAEVAVFHRPSATLMLMDLAFNMVRFESAFERVAWRLSGVPASFGPSRTARTFLLNDRRMAADFLERVLAWPFQRVLVAHGEPLEDLAADVFQHAFAGFLADATAPRVGGSAHE
jgi:hypothetical protein